MCGHLLEWLLSNHSDTTSDQTVHYRTFDFEIVSELRFVR
jgi:hypothetical protein